MWLWQNSFLCHGGPGILFCLWMIAGRRVQIKHMVFLVMGHLSSKSAMKNFPYIEYLLYFESLWLGRNQSYSVISWLDQIHQEWSFTLNLFRTVNRSAEWINVWVNNGEELCAHQQWESWRPSQNSVYHKETGLGCKFCFLYNFLLSKSSLRIYFYHSHPCMRWVFS